MFKNSHFVQGAEELFHSFSERHALFLTLLAWVLLIGVTVGALLNAAASY